MASHWNPSNAPADSRPFLSEEWMTKTPPFCRWEKSPIQVSGRVTISVRLPHTLSQGNSCNLQSSNLARNTAEYLLKHFMLNALLNGIWDSMVALCLNRLTAPGVPRRTTQHNWILNKSDDIPGLGKRQYFQRYNPSEPVCSKKWWIQALFYVEAVYLLL